MAAETFDAIVAGGGHNGPVAAAYLARSGARTMVLEARESTGGAATTEQPWPDASRFRVTRLSYVMSLLPPTILGDLRLEKHGYKIFPMGPYYQAFPEGGSLTLHEEDSRFTRALSALAAAPAHTGLLALRHLLAPRAAPLPSPPPAKTERRDRWAARLTDGMHGVTGAGLFALLRDYGIPLVRALPATTPGEALAAAAVIGYPVALKTGEPRIAHKSDAGGVRLGIGSAAGLIAAYTDLDARLGPRVIVTELAPPGPEVIVGMARDQALGPLIVTGAGGVLADFYSERAVALPPVTDSAAAAMLGGLRVAEVLAGVRGNPPCDLAAVSAAIVSMSVLACELGDHLEAFDVNPLICGPSGVIAVDALAIPRGRRGSA
jgi:ATP-grasp domain-containing protein/putative NAD(P)-binding protein